MNVFDEYVVGVCLVYVDFFLVVVIVCVFDLVVIDEM